MSLHWREGVDVKNFVREDLPHDWKFESEEKSLHSAYKWQRNNFTHMWSHRTISTHSVVWLLIEGKYCAFCSSIRKDFTTPACTSPNIIPKRRIIATTETDCIFKTEFLLIAKSICKKRFWFFRRWKRISQFTLNNFVHFHFFSFFFFHFSYINCYMCALFSWQEHCHWLYDSAKPKKI